MKTKNSIKKIKKQTKLSINCIGLYKTMLSTKVIMNLYVIILLKIWMKRKMKSFHKYEYKNKINFS